MDVLIKLWAHMLLMLMGLGIATLEFFDAPTIMLWRDILPTYRAMFGLG